MRIVVVGAGIAGLVAAGAAQRAGHQVTVLERSAPGSAAGAGISLWGNAMRALDAIPAAQPARVGQGDSDASENSEPLSLGQRVRAIGGAPRAGSPAGIRLPSGRCLSGPWSANAVSSALAARSRSCTAPTCSAC